MTYQISVNEVSIIALVKRVLKFWKFIVLSQVVVSLFFVFAYYKLNDNTIIYVQNFSLVPATNRLTTHGEFNSPLTNIADYSNIFQRSEFQNYIKNKTNLAFNASVISLPNAEFSLIITDTILSNTEFKTILDAFKDNSELYLNYITQKESIVSFRTQTKTQLNKLSSQLKIESNNLDVILNSLNLYSEPISVVPKELNQSIAIAQLTREFVSQELKIKVIQNQIELYNLSITILDDSEPSFSSFEKYLLENQQIDSEITSISNDISFLDDVTILSEEEFNLRDFLLYSIITNAILCIVIIFIKDILSIHEHSQNHL